MQYICNSLYVSGKPEVELAWHILQTYVNYTFKPVGYNYALHFKKTRFILAHAIYNLTKQQANNTNISLFQSP